MKFFRIILEFFRKEKTIIDCPITEQMLEDCIKNSVKEVYAKDINFIFGPINIEDLIRQQEEKLK
jgi:hypothetical protein